MHRNVYLDDVLQMANEREIGGTTQITDTVTNFGIPHR